jgi:tripartite-type tricarboxylate transporter receptor subunit TctC
MLKLGQILTAFAALICAGPAAHAQTATYPTRPVKLVLAFGAGGSADVIARLIGNKISETWGQVLLIENKPGADGDLAGEAVARAPPDGYTLLLTSQVLAVNVSLRPKRPYKLEELAPVMLVADTQGVLVVPVEFEAKSVKDVIALAKAKPGKLDFGSTGVGTSGHLAMELFRITAGIDIVHVPFRNIGQWMTDMIAGRIVLGIPTVPGATTHIRAGKLRALGVTGSRRTAALPDVPTVVEAGLPGYTATTWYPLMAPRGTPEPVVARINAAFKAAMEDPVIKTKLGDLGVEPVASSPAELAKHITAEVERWSRVVAQAGIKSE